MDHWTALLRCVLALRPPLVPIKWNHLIDKDSLKIKELEHVGIEKVEQLFSGHALGKQRKSTRVHRSFPAGNGDLPAFLSLTGHLLQKPRGEAMNAETLLLCAGHR
jgi:hypothetical protein